MRKRPNILSIAGLDPSSGAGLTSDIKTFEKLKCYGYSICTAITIQNETEFKQCVWTDLTIILNQIDIVFKTKTFDFVKIGIIENSNVLKQVIDFLKYKNKNIKIVLDPILFSSSGFNFHDAENDFLMEDILQNIYLLTPNYIEIKQLYPNKDLEQTISYLASKTNLFLKGGHNADDIGKDKLFLKNGKSFSFRPKTKKVFPKHGSGCVLSSAITAYLALNFPLLKACYRGKRYTEAFLSSNKTLLGYHV